MDAETGTQSKLTFTETVFFKNKLLVTLINSVLGTGKKTARGNMAYHCPYCNHHKPKF